MVPAPIVSVADRIDTALSRLETAVARLNGEEGVPARHRALRRVVAKNLQELDAVIADLSK